MVIRPATPRSSEDPWRSRGRVSTMRPVRDHAPATLTPSGDGGTRTTPIAFRASLSLWLRRHATGHRADTGGSFTDQSPRILDPLIPRSRRIDTRVSVIL